ncbi:ribonuclease III [Mesonia sp. K7]|uniref:ribonuclease III n=1 Tax=Mesonia sp. K7 TaxID=2218606 RepID=UPI000DA9014C|nr:ribonuclease III [Mesonia sp. K7]PZD79058.1 ribonuclease III [Mesonia sp. K7]
MNIIRNIWNSRPERDGNFFSAIKQILGFKPKVIAHYQRAFTHKSLNLKDEKGNELNYERLEFLGDAMLSSIISAYLFNEVPTGNEGYLTKMRSKVVSRQHLNELGMDLNLAEFVRSNIPTSHYGDNIHGNLFEALIGAIYLDQGYKACERFIFKRVIKPYVDIDKLEGRVISYKSLFIEWCQKEKKNYNYEIYEDNGVDLQKHFGVRLYVDGKVIAKARATSKKKAEEKASKRAYFAFQNEIDQK